MKNWVVDVTKKHPLLRKFKEWFDNEEGDEHNFSLNYYGYDDGYTCFNDVPDGVELITLEQWHEMYFPKNNQFEKGEIVEVSDNEIDWYKEKFISEFEGKYVSITEDGIESWKYIRKYSPLQQKIDELKDLAEKEGLKITINIE